MWRYEHDWLLERADGFTVWYESGGSAVGVLTHAIDDEYDTGEALIAEARPAPVPMN
jgi:3-phenylpropionate/trans-cinnamate dioxygenase ferredoxin reductase subunit